MEIEIGLENPAVGERDPRHTCRFNRHPEERAAFSFRHVHDDKNGPYDIVMWLMRFHIPKSHYTEELLRRELSAIVEDSAPLAFKENPHAVYDVGVSVAEDKGSQPLFECHVFADPSRTLDELAARFAEVEAQAHIVTLYVTVSSRRVSDHRTEALDYIRDMKRFEFWQDDNNNENDDDDEPADDPQ